MAHGLRSFTPTAKRVVLEAAKFGQDRLERMEEANRQRTAMAPHVLRRILRRTAQ